MKHSLLQTLVMLSLVVRPAIADDKSGASVAGPIIEVTDVRGAKHLVSDFKFANQANFGIPQTSGQEAINAGLQRFVPVELHPPDEEGIILKIAQDRGNPNARSAVPVLLISPDSIKDIALTQRKSDDASQRGILGTSRAIASSVIRESDGAPFPAGGLFGRIIGKENLGLLGTGDFSLDSKDLTELHFPSPVSFAGDISFLSSTEVPFSAKVTDTAGGVSVLTKALYVEQIEYGVATENGEQTRAHRIQVSSGLKASVSQTTQVSMSPEKLKWLTLGNDKFQTNVGFAAKATLRNGDTANLTILHVFPNDPYGILGVSSKGLVWIPWWAISSVEYDNP